MKEKIIRLLFFVFLIFLPFSAKKFLFSLPALLFGNQINELNSVFLFASDIFLILFVVSVLWFWGQDFKKIVISNKLILVFLVLGLVSIFFASDIYMSFYFRLRFLLVSSAAFAIGVLIKNSLLKFDCIMFGLGLSAVFQSMVAILQFLAQKSIGLWFLGESIINLNSEGVARVMINGVKMLRAYGTMPHANILAGFLILGLIALFYLFIRNFNDKFWKKLLISVGIFIICLGLIFSFSRSGWIAALISIVLFFVLGFFNKAERKKFWQLLALLFCIFAILFFAFGSMIFPRAHFSSGEISVNHRMIYNKIGLEIIKGNPLGVGIGNQVIFGVNNGLYEKYGLKESWSWQPVHNIYLLIGSELGVFGLIVFLLIIIFLIFQKDNEKRFLIFKKNLDFNVLLTILSGFLIFGLFDHFYWDLQSGRLMFWLVLGMMIGLSPRRSTDPRTIIN
ncbi:MAG: O-antigen ligase family protein [Patescibacteria group bacterium]|nr:O-antigen ligase family protein [Patescibacteria group bacterium]